VIAVMRERLAAGEQVAWLERQAQTAEELITVRQNQERQVD